jgi:hypothetical protein
VNRHVLCEDLLGQKEELVYEKNKKEKKKGYEKREKSVPDNVPEKRSGNTPVLFD